MHLEQNYLYSYKKKKRPINQQFFGKEANEKGKDKTKEKD
jgi:hypothetical protein